MSKKISQFTELVNISGNEEIPVQILGTNFKIKLSSLKKLIDKNDVGLGNVDNTSDINKPVSSLVLTELNKKAPNAHNHNTSDINNLLEFVTNAINDLSTVSFIKSEW